MVLLIGIDDPQVRPTMIKPRVTLTIDVVALPGITMVKPKDCPVKVGQLLYSLDPHQTADVSTTTRYRPLAMANKVEILIVDQGVCYDLTMPVAKGKFDGHEQRWLLRVMYYMLANGLPQPRLDLA